MKKIIMMLMVTLFVAVGLSAQEVKVVEKESKKELRQKKKAERKVAYELFKSEGLNKIDDRDFVLQANQISGSTGRPILVTDNFNFVKIDGDKIIVQYGLNGRIGANGVGGFTFQGDIRKIESKDAGKGKPGNVRVDFVSPSIRGLASVYVNIRGDKASAQLSNNGQIINFSGDYLSKEEAFIIQGRNNSIF